MIRGSGRGESLRETEREPTGCVSTLTTAVLLRTGSIAPPFGPDLGVAAANTQDAPFQGEARRGSGGNAIKREQAT